MDYLGLPDLAEVTRRLVDADWRSEDSLQERLNHAFWGLEQALAGAFERTYAESPEDFAPLVADGVDRRSYSVGAGCASGNSLAAADVDS
ncbi:hypothetical protein [Catenuloplanes indicus]|uniref:Uncharacterized protein n=1 Tax=Catenuloplanes indicus TaxID=137267 RepID=A0AAE3VVL2_9ACTN|nr:hypothetical protein [Catenuloplanes indicus]MDQ0364027.1 hypothetical protein [Catenuloplanes indicus]